MLKVLMISDLCSRDKIMPTILVPGYCYMYNKMCFI